MTEIGLYDRFAEEDPNISPVFPENHDDAAEYAESLVLLSLEPDTFIDNGLIVATAGTVTDYGFITALATALLDYGIGSAYTFKVAGIANVGLVRISVILQQNAYEALNSYVVIGLFGLTDEETVDRQSYVINVEIGMVDDAVSATYDDWASPVLYPSDISEDWALTNADEDWGGDPVLSVNYTPTIDSSLDGYKRTPEQNEVLTEENAEGRTKLFSCDSTGVFHALKISAVETEQNFYLKTKGGIIPR